MSRATSRGAVAATFLLVGVLAGLAGATAPPLVGTAHNAALKATILVDRNGRTLYHLSVERQGRFVCDNASCLAFWRPLVVAKGVKPVGAVPLGTVKRPDGRIQVTYKGAPLYAFVQDTKRGETKGEGFKDVGVWHAATVGSSSAKTKPSSGGYRGYGN